MVGLGSGSGSCGLQFPLWGVVGWLAWRSVACQPETRAAIGGGGVHGLCLQPQVLEAGLSGQEKIHSPLCPIRAGRFCPTLPILLFNTNYVSCVLYFHHSLRNFLIEYSETRPCVFMIFLDNGMERLLYFTLQLLSSNVARYRLFCKGLQSE